MKAQLRDFLDIARADDLMITSHIHDREMVRRSLEMNAQFR